MNCILCGKKIGTLRMLADREFCSPQHRAQFRLVSARALRDADDEIWPVPVRGERRKAPKAGTHSGTTASGFAVIAIAMLALAGLSLPGSSSSAATLRSTPAPGGGFNPLAQISSTIGNAVRSRTPVTLREDFRSGLNEWSDSAANMADLRAPQVNSSGLHPGRLQIWKRSSLLTNYEVEFLGQIDNKSLGWAFRATNPNNYYGTKITITGPRGNAPNTSLVRYTMQNGHELDRVRMPLPLSMSPGAPYTIHMSVKDDRFVTWVNNQVVSSWSDSRFRTGGLGFFSDEGESSEIRWVSLTERDSLLGRVAAYFSLIQFPTNLD